MGVKGVRGVRGTILLVEDETDTREMLASALERGGYRCVAAGDAQHALEQARGAGFVDAVVTDVVLGDDDRAGLRLLTDLRASGGPRSRGRHHRVRRRREGQDGPERGRRASPREALPCLDAPRGDRAVRAAREATRVTRSSSSSSRASLTEKERTVARHLLEGLSSSEIAESTQQPEDHPPAREPDLREVRGEQPRRALSARLRAVKSGEVAASVHPCPWAARDAVGWRLPRWTTPPRWSRE